MNHDVLKEVILDQLEIIKTAEIIDRNYFFEKNVNYILVGLRRAGKSTLLYKIAKELETRSLFHLAEKSKDIEKLIIVTNEEEHIIEKNGIEIEVIPIHKFLLCA